jgi:predicted phosphodiesterase
MKIAVISDIHGNVFALKAVLEDLKKRGAGTIVNLGDIFYGPIAPKATYELLQKNEIVTIQGNQDRQIYASNPDEIEANPTMAFVMDELKGEPLQWLRSLPRKLHLSDDVYLCHGGPGDDLVYLLENIDSGYPVIRTDDEVVDLLEGVASSLVLCGHTHIPRCVSLGSGQLIVNPGSVGLPAYSDDLPVYHRMENYSPHASYAIIEKDHTGWRVEHYKIPYDVDLAAHACRKRQRDDWAGCLKTGRAG